MIEWYFDISPNSPDTFHQESFIEKIINIALPFMNYFCNRLEEYENWTAEDANKVFIDVVEEMPVMTGFIRDGEFVIRYNRYIEIYLIGNTKQIYRDIKINRFLKEKRNYD